MNVILPVVIFASWLALVLAPAARYAIEDEQNLVPQDKRRGVSILPGFPVFPLIAWGAALALDHFVSPWGVRVFLGIHGVLLAVALSAMARDMFRLRRIRR
jgi:hypothetical protein